MEHPIKMDDLGVPLFSEHPYTKSHGLLIHTTIHVLDQHTFFYEQTYSE